MISNIPAPKDTQNSIKKFSRAIRALDLKILRALTVF
jgi:hypothetical protein